MFVCVSVKLEIPLTSASPNVEIFEKIFVRQTDKSAHVSIIERQKRISLRVKKRKLLLILHNPFEIYELELFYY